MGVVQGARDAALESAAALEVEKAQLKAGLGGALEQRQALEAQLAALSAKQQSLCQAVRSCIPFSSHSQCPRPFQNCYYQLLEPFPECLWRRSCQYIL